MDLVVRVATMLLILGCEAGEPSTEARPLRYVDLDHGFGYRGWHMQRDRLARCWVALAPFLCAVGVGTLLTACHSSGVKVKDAAAPAGGTLADAGTGGTSGAGIGGAPAGGRIETGGIAGTGGFNGVASSGGVTGAGGVTTTGGLANSGGVISSGGVVTDPLGHFHMENVDRGVVAVKVDGGVYVGWRMLGYEYPTTASDVAYNLYRDGAKVATVSDSTNYLDASGTGSASYTVAAAI